MSQRKEYNDRWSTPLAELYSKKEEPTPTERCETVVLTRVQFEKLYGKCPDELWDILVSGHKELTDSKE